MIIKPRVRGFMCITSHPVGCENNVVEQINYIKRQEPIEGPKRVLVIGSSTGYGLSHYGRFWLWRCDTRCVF
jgi:enoyl-[acyl-carrier protein] reductase/trans-2-enoyl-CoA reductase (NAD+)